MLKLGTACIVSGSRHIHPVLGRCASSYKEHQRRQRKRRLGRRAFHLHTPLQL